MNTEKTEFPESITINSHTIEIIPRYCETDQAGVVHHTVYPVWLEMGRTELLRVNGLAYKDLEKAGIYFVVVDLTVKYRKPAYYDEKINLTTTCTNITLARVEHTYSLKNASTGILLAEAKSTLACVEQNGSIRRMPSFMFSQKNKPENKPKKIPTSS